MVCCAKPYQCIEDKIIDKLLRSKHYIGRNICTTDPDVYFKNKKICEIIDKLRYGSNNEKLIHKIKQILRRQKLNIDGGSADTIYLCNQRLDLGKAGSTMAELDYKCYPHKKIDGGNAMDIYPKENILDLGLASSDKATLQAGGYHGENADGGDAKQDKCRIIIDLQGASRVTYGEYIVAPTLYYGNGAILEVEEYIDYNVDGGDATVNPYKRQIELGSAREQPFGKDLLGPSEFTSDKALLQYGKYSEYYLDGGKADKDYNNKNIDLGSAFEQEILTIEELPANIKTNQDSVISKKYSKAAKLKSEQFSGAFVSAGKARACGKYLDVGASA